MSDVIFDDMFTVKNIDPDGKKFDRCSRLFCDSESFSMELILDVNTQIYPVNLNDKFRLMITTSVRDDGMPDEGEHDPQVMDELVYYIDSAPSLILSAFNLHGFGLDSNIYLLIKKVEF
ncbi:unnamed protein product [Angiostrongylus costaricensis]|uniref:DNA_pol_B_exo1 domain-containing protein n=1 Tax=Angiostrongylus costaricensis TaxID=334426 RepID=A0A0R3PS78_ANGCS|nr:unnamed protein product [Angiostrongylus costaricensis]